MDAPNREPTPEAEGGVPLSARALPGSAAICERDRSSFQKLFLLWDLALGGDQQEAGSRRSSDQQRGGRFFSSFPAAPHTLTHPDTPLRPFPSRVSTPLLLFPLSLLRGREREREREREKERFRAPRSIPRDFWSLSSWRCRLPQAITGSVSLISLSPTSNGLDESPNDDAERARPTPARTRRAALHFTRRYLGSIASIDDCSPPLVTMTDDKPATSAGHC